MENLTHVKEIITNNKFIFSKDSLLKDIKHQNINLKEIVTLKLQKILLFPKRNSIEPVYISNNKILN